MHKTSQATPNNNIQKTLEDKIFIFFITLFIILLIISIIYPLYFVFIASFTDPYIISTGKIVLIPTNVTWAGYRNIFQNERIWIGYRNTIFYVLFGTTTSVIVTIMAAYSLSRDSLPGRNLIMGMMVFTMYFSGGLIPTYLTMRTLHLINKPIIIIILGAFSVYNMIIARTYFVTSIPKELYDSAIIDGAGHFTFFTKIVLPISKPIIAVIALYFFVSQWNGFFNALIYLNDSNYYPLQLVLRSILLESSAFSQNVSSIGQLGEGEISIQQLAENIKYGVIVVSTVPLIIVYPFVQKYFVQGVMIGAIKG